VCAIALVLSGCGMLSFSSADDQGYLLRSEEGGAGVGTLYVTYEPGEQAGVVTGYMHTAYPAENPEGAYFETQRIEGSVDGTRILVWPEGNPQAEYVGTVEDGAMQLQNGLASWDGEAATFGDFGEAAEEVAEASEEGDFAD
jgi:hypothetical protein